MTRACADVSADKQVTDIAGLRARGWTSRLIREFLCEPDGYECPHGQRSGRPKGLYSVERVQQIEEHDERFRSERERAATFSGRLRGTHDVKQKNLVAVVEAIALPMLNEPLEDLLEAARLTQNFDAEKSLKSVERVALDMSSAKFSSLAWRLEMFRGHAGIRSARILLAQKIEAHIINRYPSLSVAATNADERAGAGTRGQQHEKASSFEQRDPNRL